jgi:hypothetical protein
LTCPSPFQTMAGRRAATRSPLCCHANDPIAIACLIKSGQQKSFNCSEKFP